VSRVWSSLQAAIFAFIVEDKRNLIIEAVAGSGKTTTIEEIARRLGKGVSYLFLAFNKSIATELAGRGLNARTFHSICYSIMLKYWGVNAVDDKKVDKIIEQHMTPPQYRMYGQFVDKLVGLAKQTGIGCLVEDTEQNWNDLAVHHDLELEQEDADWATAIAQAQKILAISNNTRALDWNDLLYLAVKDGVALPKFDVVMVDEAQDTNPVRRAILRKVMKDGGRLIAVGDPHQAIYGFTGADSDALELIAKDFDAVTMPLSVSYRCPQKVVQHAKRWVNHIEFHETAPEGKVTDLGTSWKAVDMKANDMVICRTTAPLIGLAYRLLTARIPVMIRGKDIGGGLKALIKRLNAKGIPALEMKLDIWATREIEKARAKKQEAKMEQIADKRDCIQHLINTMPERNRTIPALVDVIDALFAEKADAVVLSTIHRAKGLEAHKVYWLNHHKCPAMWARQAWQRQQEVNLCYVATTRAKSELILIEEVKDEDPKTQA
jgi:DNA helicase II / ATP-dependent DNA helicase PcrA